MQPEHRPVVFGEVLFDRFEDGRTVLGGAPFNVAWHLQGFGLAPLLISRVGEDAAGAQVLEAARRWGLDTAGIQRDPERPTGVVDVRLVGARVEFSIRPQQAYDFVDADAAEAALGGGGFGLLYHGTLAARSPASRAALERLRARALPVFLDVNLRPPWWGRAGVEAALAGARWVKLNADELAALRRDDPDLGSGARALCREHGLAFVIVTRGEAGALLVSGDRVVEAPAAPVRKMVDTVGAGDAFSAAVILGLARSWAPETTLARAAEFAAAVCAIRGAVPGDRGLYLQTLERWR